MNIDRTVDRGELALQHVLSIKQRVDGFERYLVQAMEAREASDLETRRIIAEHIAEGSRSVRRGSAQKLWIAVIGAAGVIATAASGVASSWVGSSRATAQAEITAGQVVDRDAVGREARIARSAVELYADTVTAQEIRRQVALAIASAPMQRVDSRPEKR